MATVGAAGEGGAEKTAVSTLALFHAMLATPFNQLAEPPSCHVPLPPCAPANAGDESHVNVFPARATNWALSVVAATAAKINVRVRRVGNSLSFVRDVRITSTQRFRDNLSSDAIVRFG
jgi:hypothetical protein